MSTHTDFTIREIRTVVNDDYLGCEFYSQFTIQQFTKTIKKIKKKKKHNFKCIKKTIKF